MKFVNLVQMQSRGHQSETLTFQNRKNSPPYTVFTYNIYTILHNFGQTAFFMEITSVC